MLGQITDELRASQFIPTQFERVIGNADEGGLPSPKLILSDGSRVILNGKIDRIDLYREGKTVYVRVVDYKSGSRSRFSIEDVRSGMDIQLVLYLYAILAADPDMRAAGAQYLYAKSEKGHVDISRSGFLLDEPSVKAAADGTAESLYTKKLTALSTEQINALAEDMKGAVLSVAERILSGEAQKTPSQDACSLCPIRSNCDRAYHD